MFKTALLLAAITALFLAVGYAMGGEGGMMVALVFALITNFFSYWYSDRIVLSIYRARPIDPAEHPRLYGMIERLAARAGIPMPKAYLIDTPQPNAFATGRNPSHAAVAVTAGLLRTLDERELAAVLAHELGHIRNYDTLIMTVTATIAGAIGMIANFLMFFGGHHRNNRLGALGSLALMILAPLMAMLVQLAISRTREYGADASGAQVSGDPLALASALRKISGGGAHIPNPAAETHPATAHLFIVNPLHRRGMDNLFTTHPSAENRIRALKEMAQSMGTAAQEASFQKEAPVEQNDNVRHGSFGFLRRRGPWR